MTKQRRRRSAPEERVPNAAFSGPSPPNPLLQPRPPISKPKTEKDTSKIIHQLWEWRKPKKEQQSSARSVKFEYRRLRRSTPEERVFDLGLPRILPNNPTIRPYPPLYQPKAPLRLIRVKHKPWEIGRPGEESPNFPFPEPSTANPLLQEESSEVPIKVTDQLWKRSRPEERVPNYSFPGLSTIRPIVIHKPIMKPNFRKYNKKYLIRPFSRRQLLELKNKEDDHLDVSKKNLLLLRPHILQESLSRWDPIVIIIMLSTMFVAVFFIVFYRRLNRRHRAKRTLLGEF